MLRKRLIKICKIAGSLLLIVTIVILSVSYYLETHKEEVFQKFETWYIENYHGNLAFEDISISTYRNFPNVALTLENFTISDSLANYSSGSLKLEKIRLFVSFKNIFKKKKITFKTLELENGELKLLTLKGTPPSKRKLFSKRLADTLLTQKASDDWFSKKDINIRLEKIKFSLINHSKNKRITGLINKLDTKLSISDSIIISSADMDIQMKELGFNLDNGTFFNDANLAGKLSVTYHNTKDHVEIPLFDLKINEQLFKVKADIITTDSGSFDITLENDQNDLRATILLLSQNIQQKIENYTSSKPLYTFTEIKGGFEHGNNPLVKIRCKTTDNDIRVNKDILLKNVSFSGDFTNRIYSDERADLESVKDAQINLNNLTATVDNLSISIEQVNLLSIPEIDTLDLSKEQPKWLSDKSVKISIAEGQFSFKDSIKNKRITGFINKLDTRLYINDKNIHSVTDMDIQMKEMGLNLKNGTFFNDAKLTGNFGSLYQIQKQHISVPFFKLNIDKQQFNVKAAISTKVSGSFNFVLENPRTNFKATSSLLSQNIQKKLKIYKVAKPIYTYATLIGRFEHGSNPLVTIYSETQNNDITIDDQFEFNKVNFSGSFINRVPVYEPTKTEDKKDLNINFKTLSAEFEGITLDFNRASLVSTPEVKTYADYEFTVKEPATVLNSFFNNDKFIFTDGELDFKSSFKGELRDLNSLYYNSQSKLRLNQSKILYEPLDLEFPIDELLVEIKNAYGYVESLVIPVNGTRNNLKFKGEIDNIVSLALDGDANVKSNLELYSEKIIWSDFFSMFKVSDEYKKERTKSNEEFLLNETLNVIRQKFNPQFDLSLANFIYQNTTIKNISSEVVFSEENLHMRKTGFDYGDGHVDLGLFFDISSTDETLFDFNIDIENVDLEQLLKEFNYFELSSLKEAKKVSGIISLNSEVTGTISEEKGLDTKSLEGFVNFDLRKFELSEFEPIQKIGNKIFRKERFEDIRFADVTDELYISNRTIQIPLIEIRSTAFDLFIEGHYSYDYNSNIWISIPLSNIKKRDLVDIPDKEGFNETGNKVFIEVTQNEENIFEYKFHLNKKKFYEERGILEQYHEYQKTNKDEKKESKKMERKKKKLMKKNYN